jgi:hypothetical protein
MGANRMRAYLAGGTIFLVFCLPLLGAQSVQQRLQTKVQNYKLSEPTFLDALLKVGSDFKVPMGVELVKSQSVLRPVDRSWREATAMEILTALVRGETGYRLRVDDGILHVFAKDLVDQRSNFLNIRIKKFDVQDTSAPVAGLKLWGLVNPHFQRPSTPTPGPHGTVGTGIRGGTPERTFSLSLRDASVRHVLDAIASSSGHKIWAVTFAPGSSSITYTGFRRVVSPINDKIPSDAYQPGWEALRWGEKPY